MPGLTFDAGGLIAFERADRRLDVLLRSIRMAGESVTIPATVLAQVIRDPRRQARLARLARHPMTTVAPLDNADAVGVGRLLAASRTADIADAHVVLCARRSGQRVVTTDPEDLAALDPDAELIAI
jgi:hypothetical protein